jgi:hypothetical protein
VATYETIASVAANDATPCRPQDPCQRPLNPSLTSKQPLCPNMRNKEISTHVLIMLEILS